MKSLLLAIHAFIGRTVAEHREYCRRHGHE